MPEIEEYVGKDWNPRTVAESLPRLVEGPLQDYGLPDYDIESIGEPYEGASNLYEQAIQKYDLVKRDPGLLEGLYDRFLGDSKVNISWGVVNSLPKRAVKVRGDVDIRDPEGYVFHKLLFGYWIGNRSMFEKLDESVEGWLGDQTFEVAYQADENARPNIPPFETVAMAGASTREFYFLDPGFRGTGIEVEDVNIEGVGQEDLDELMNLLRSL